MYWQAHEELAIPDDKSLLLFGSETLLFSFNYQKLKRKHTMTINGVLIEPGTHSVGVGFVKQEKDFQIFRDKKI